jgi:hypothetical protein
MLTDVSPESVTNGGKTGPAGLVEDRGFAVVVCDGEVLLGVVCFSDDVWLGTAGLSVLVCDGGA